jgi:hypothetical protein
VAKLEIPRTSESRRGDPGGFLKTLSAAQKDDVHLSMTAAAMTRSHGWARVTVTHCPDWLSVFDPVVGGRWLVIILVEATLPAKAEVAR